MRSLRYVVANALRVFVSVKNKRRSAQDKDISFSMRQSTIILSLLALLVALIGCKAAVVHLVGNWMAATKNVHTEDLLAQALQKQNTKLKSPLCFTEVTYIEQQIVNGIHFRYHILGCETTTPGRCSTDCTTPSKYAVEVFAQPWADVVQVVSGAQVQ
ncbi:hypothetical protein PHYBOEH_008985 [Phytophthora boehmeriae]|uniref:Uncharacterized protein n=1 Tax=Phytophthora boehmeriae TaxID=109152 RepID=A0A8T1VWI6_9STRA|nr:hypothetical protein PHYBOEH_008985 [Phytophthora boehmeriae]